MSPPKTTRVTIKSLQESLQNVLNERDDLRQMVENQRVSLHEQRKVIADAWAEARDLRSRLDSLHNILHGATQVARVPQLALGQCDTAMSSESPR